jgi:esterase/lipase superfamily enzyme
VLLPAIAVLSDETTWTQAETALHPYADRARVAISRRAGPVVVWYLFAAQDVRARGAAAAAPGARLRDLLDLDAVQPIETVQASAAPAAATDRRILVLDGDRVAGILEPGIAAQEGPDAARGVRDQIGFRGERTAAEKPPFEVIRVFYGTDRRAESDATVAPYYGADRGTLAFGSAEVSIPSNRDRGTLPRPAWWRLEFRENPARHVMVTAVRPLARETFLADIRSTFQQASQKHALLFIHGYNVTFADALMRTGQIAFDLRSDELIEFPGVPLLYSWPSLGQTLGYLRDETLIRWTQPHFEQFLRIALSETGADVVHVIAHSMGTRALIECLSTLDLSGLPAGSAVLDQVVFAAPDFDADTLADLAAQLSSRAKRCTLYASSGDLALRTSRELRGGLRRAGESGEDLLVVNGIDTIDASNVDTSLLGHGYFGERTILGDIFYLLKDRKSPDERFGLIRRTRANVKYWEMAK